ncbi:MAG: SMUG2 DNA glycosylase family protein [Eubacterium sp.]|nr:SMUG2 DNA glycosylase family protein [Eubacterium sp.]
MSEGLSFAEKILLFNEDLSSKSLDLPDGFKIINPFREENKEEIMEISKVFYGKYYDDSHTRRLILGSSPARRGSAITGIPFEDAFYLQREAGIRIEKYYVNKSSTGFLSDVIAEYGGRGKFYQDFYMNFVCPLGIVKTNLKGREINCNYYENEKLRDFLYSFIVEALRSQIAFGIDVSVCYCIGSGENYKFLSRINEKHRFFGKILPLEHPRFIMQYNSKRKDEFIKKYLNALCDQVER